MAAWGWGCAMLGRFLVFVVIVVVLLAQIPQAIGTVRVWLRDATQSWLQQDAVTSTERAKELGTKGLRGQLVSFSEGMVALDGDDTSRSVDERYSLYAIPITQLSLKKPEFIPNGNAEGLLNDLPQLVPGETFSSPPSANSGKYSNIRLFDRKLGTFQKLFDKRVSISQFQRGWNTKPGVLVIFAADRDGDANGTMDDDDVHDIYVLTLADRVLHKVSGTSMNPVSVMEIPSVDYLIVKAKVDRDRDGYAPRSAYGDEAEIEPDRLFRVDLKTFTATPFVPEAMVDELQRTLDAVPEKPATPPSPEPAKKP